MLEGVQGRAVGVDTRCVRGGRGRCVRLRGGRGMCVRVGSDRCVRGGRG